MPRILDKHGRPLTQRIGTNIPFLAYEEVENFKKIQDLVSEYNARSHKRMVVSVLGNDGSLSVMGTKSIVSTLMKSSFVPEAVNGIHKNPEYWTDKATFKVPLIILPNESQLEKLSEAACEDQISKLLTVSCYPYSNHFSRKDANIPYCWPKFVTPRPPSKISLTKDNGTGMQFSSRREFLMFILETMLFAYFYNYMFGVFGVILNSTGRGPVFMASETFSTELPFSTDGLPRYTREVEPCPRKNSAIGDLIDKQSAQSEINKDSISDPPSTLWDASQNRQNDENDEPVEKSEPDMEKSKKPQSAKGMPFLLPHDRPVDANCRQDGRLVKIAAPRRLKMRRYTRRVNGKESFILCVCPDIIKSNTIQTIKCSCGVSNHATCMPSNAKICVVCYHKK